MQISPTTKSDVEISYILPLRNILILCSFSKRFCNAVLYYYYLGGGKPEKNKDFDFKPPHNIIYFDEKPVLKSIFFHLTMFLFVV